MPPVWSLEWGFCWWISDHLSSSPPDQTSVEPGTMPTAAQAGRLSPGGTSALFVSIITSPVPPLIWVAHDSDVFITITCRHPAHCCFYWNIPAAAYHIQSGAPGENVLYPQRVTALMEEKVGRRFKRSGFSFDRPHNRNRYENGTWVFFTPAAHLLPSGSAACCSLWPLQAKHTGAVFSILWFPLCTSVPNSALQFTLM